MTVFRVEKTKDFTIMSNHHLRNRILSLKAKGLLSLMLSLPEDWDYTTKGLAQICKEGVDSISTALKELEKHGYLTRHRIRYKNGQLGDVEYTIHERPLDHSERGILPDQENPEHVKPMQDIPAQLNTKKQNTNLSINLSALGTDYKAGASQPSGTAMRLMQIFETAPEIVSKIAGESKSRMLGRNRRKRDISKG